MSLSEHVNFSYGSVTFTIQFGLVTAGAQRGCCYVDIHLHTVKHATVLLLVSDAVVEVKPLSDKTASRGHHRKCYNDDKIRHTTTTSIF